MVLWNLLQQFFRQSILIIKVVRRLHNGWTRCAEGRFDKLKPRVILQESNGHWCIRNRLIDERQMGLTYQRDL